MRLDIPVPTQLNGAKAISLLNQKYRGTTAFMTCILSRASEAGSPTNRPGSDKTRGQGSFGQSTGGPDLSPYK